MPQAARDNVMIPSAIALDPAILVLRDAPWLVWLRVSSAYDLL